MILIHRDKQSLNYCKNGIDKLCNEILDEEFFENKDKTEKESKTKETDISSVPKPHEIKAYLDEHIKGQIYRCPECGAEIEFDVDFNEYEIKI